MAPNDLNDVGRNQPVRIAEFIDKLFKSSKSPTKWLWVRAAALQTACLPFPETQVVYYAPVIASSIILWISKNQLTSTQVIGYMTCHGASFRTAPTFLRRKPKRNERVPGILIGCRNDEILNRVPRSKSHVRGGVWFSRKIKLKSEIPILRKGKLPCP